MIEFTKLLCGTAAISSVMRQNRGMKEMQVSVLQFSPAKEAKPC